MLQDGDVVVARSFSIAGGGFKSAVASIPEGESLIALGNLYVIELGDEKERKLEPYYLQAFFDSEAGRAAWNTIAASDNFATISLSDLKNLPVPVPSMEKQRKVAQDYRELSQKAQEYRKKLADVQRRLTRTWPDGDPETETKNENEEADSADS